MRGVEGAEPLFIRLGRGAARACGCGVFAAKVGRSAAGRRLLGLAIALLLCCSSATVWALSIEDVKRMAAAGLDENTIISIIENSGDKFAIDAKVETELKSAGVSERVIKVMKATAGPAAADSGGTTGPEPAGPEPLPAGVGNLGRLIAQGSRTAKQQFDIAAAASKRIEAAKVTEQVEAKMQLAYQGVESVVRDFSNADKWASLATCHNFLVEFNPAPNTDEYYASLWCKGASFNGLGLHNLAAPILRDVVMFGGERPYFDRAFLLLVESSEAAGYFPASLADLDKLYIEDKPREFQDKFYYFLGRFFMDVLDEHDRALALLEKVRPESPLYPKALYASGVINAGPQKKLYATSVQNFQGAIVAAERAEPTQDNRDVIELGYLALARIAYEAANYDGALYYFNKVDTFSARYPEALFESAWTYFLKGDHRQALGTFHSVSSPYYDGYYFPDLWVLEATVYLNLCRYAEAKEALQVFRDLYLAKLPLLTQFMASQTDPAGYYQAVVALAEHRDGPQEGGLPALFLEAVLADVEFYNLYKVVQQIEREGKALAAKSGELGAYGGELKSKLDRLQETKLFEAGLKTQNILKRIEDELREWDVTSTEVSIEIDIAEKDLDEICLKLAAQGRACEFAAEESTVLFLVADDWQFWPFEGEYWVDEVGNYKSYLGDRCRLVEAASVPEPADDEE